jgi:inner membrane protein
VLPDADVLAFSVGIPYEHVMGHRGLSHSVLFAVCTASLFTWLAVRAARGDIPVGRLWVFLFLATASHGLLDALTDGGLGVAFLAPFSDERYFFPWRPMVVSPISIRRFFSGRGLAVVASEILVVWVPAMLAVAVAIVLRRRRPPTMGR